MIVSNPTALHLDVALPAAEAGCHILLEKPVSHSLERLDELQAACQRSGSRVLVGYHFRYHPGLRTVAALLAGGEIGHPVAARAHWGEYLPGWHPWEDYRQGYSGSALLGGGVILTLSHPLDYLSWLVGEVRSLWAFAGRLGDLELDVEDTAEIGLQFESGCIGSVHLDYYQRPPAHHLEIIGTQGTITWENATGSARIYRSADGAWDTFPPPPGFERNDLFLSEMSHFLAVARNEEPPACTLEDGINTLRLALAALQSARSSEPILF